HPVPADHDDHDGGADGHAPDRAGRGRGLRVTPAPRHRGGGRSRVLAVHHPVRDAGDLHLPGRPAATVGPRGAARVAPPRGGFGAVKAAASLAAGGLADRVGRKRILVAGWLAGVPVPFLLIWTPSWAWVVFANVLLGINQGLCWSTTVIMKIDLVGPERRG